MRKKIIIDLNGVVFEPVEANFAANARKEFGNAKGRALAFAYKYKLGRRAMKADISRVLYNCAKNPTVRPGAIDALEKIASLDGVTIEFCGQMAFPEFSKELEQQYRSMAPCMNAAAHYELISPFEPKRSYLVRTTGMDSGTMNYILGTNENDMTWPARWRILPILIRGTSPKEAELSRYCGKRVFNSLNAFAEFLAHRR